MKVYSKDNLDTYIVSSERDDDREVYNVTFANGDVYDNIPIIPENTERIEKLLYAQAYNAMPQKLKLSRDQKVGTIFRTVTTFASGAIAGYAAFLGTGEPVIVGAVSATIILGGGVWGFRHFQEVTSKLKEITDFEQRFSHCDEMDEFLTTSPNAFRYLDGNTLDEKTDRMDYIQGMKKEGRNPFNFIEMENGGVTSEEIESLSRGMVREKELAFVYTKK